MKFYDGLSDSEIKQHLAQFDENYQKQFGVRLPEWVLFDVLAQIVTQKQNEFIRQNFADLPPRTIRLMQTRIKPNALTPDEAAPLNETVIEHPDIVQEAVAETIGTIKPKRSHKKKK